MLLQISLQLEHKLAVLFISLVIHDDYTLGTVFLYQGPVRYGLLTFLIISKISIRMYQFYIYMLRFIVHCADLYSNYLIIYIYI